MKKTKVLIVDDDEWLVKQQLDILDQAGYETRATYNAWSAIDLIDEFKPDVLILDVLLPANTVFNLIHELQSYDDTSNIPIILCTNIAHELSVDNLRDYGVKLVLDKTTMLPEDLVLAIKKVTL